MSQKQMNEQRPGTCQVFSTPTVSPFLHLPLCLLRCGLASTFSETALVVTRNSSCPTQGALLSSLGQLPAGLLMPPTLHEVGSSSSAHNLEVSAFWAGGPSLSQAPSAPEHDPSGSWAQWVATHTHYRPGSVVRYSLHHLSHTLPS